MLRATFSKKATSLEFKLLVDRVPSSINKILPRLSLFEALLDIG